MSRAPIQRTILISVDSDYMFTYTNLFDGSDASSLILVDGDRLAWILDSSLEWRTFQIDFGTVNPFHLGTQLSLRGTDFIVSDPVVFPLRYIGNRVIKYSVSLGNGWVDDPDVVPVPTDTVIIDAFYKPNEAISWTDDSESAINLDPLNMTADATDVGGLAQVSWHWNGEEPDTQPFTLDFLDPIPQGWPVTTTYSTNSNGNPTITLFLPPGPAGDVPQFRITTTTLEGDQTTQDGTLVIS
jgi:hypothetical protein